MPSSVPMAAAVTAWSPVIIRTSMPALWHLAIAALASARGGSTIPTMAMIVRSCISSRRSASGSNWPGSKSAARHDHDPLARLGHPLVLRDRSGLVIRGDAANLAVR